ncbi:hypothetical protein V8G54_009067, partial [Vigna mungo]
RASSTLPCFTQPPIIVFHETKSLSSILTNKLQANPRPSSHLTYPPIIEFHVIKFLSSISSNNSRARSTAPYFTYPPIIELYETISRLGILSNTCRASSTHPHLTNNPIKQFCKNTSDPKFIFQSNPQTCIPSLTKPTLPQAFIARDNVYASRHTPFSSIKRSRTRALLGSHPLECDLITAFQRKGSS